MTAPRLSRAAGECPPVRLVHLGLGNFFRAHQAWYTTHAPDAREWGIAAFTGRGNRPLASALTEQGGLYTLVTRADEGDRFETIGSVARAHVADEHGEWLACWESEALAAVTITVTEAGYMRARGGAGVDAGDPLVEADVDTLRRNSRGLVRTAPARLLAGLLARRRAGHGPVAIIPCDNISGNGPIVWRVLAELAELVDPALASEIAEAAVPVTTMIDRITPRPTREDAERVPKATGFTDLCPVATEPFSEWVLSGSFPAGRPGWDVAGATITTDIVPFEQRKLWLLNGGHSLLAYTGALRRLRTVSDAVADATCRRWLELWWDEASAHLSQPAAEITAYRAALRRRFDNARIRHNLSQIAADGSQKLPIRIVPVLALEREAGRMPEAAVVAIAAWICHLRGVGVEISDARVADVMPLAAGSLATAVPRIISFLAPALGDDGALVAAVLDEARRLGSTAGR